MPGTPLVDSIADDGDDEATDVLARVIRAMVATRPSVHGHPTAEQWGKAFSDYVGSGDDRLATALVEEAHGVYTELCRTQRSPRLLHGDLHHGNVLRDGARGWLAIDPKGVVAEVEFEFGAALRNPPGRGDLLARSAVERRIHRFIRVLPVDAERVARWAFAQAVLSAIWTVEDGGTPRPDGAA